MRFQLNEKKPVRSERLQQEGPLPSQIAQAEEGDVAEAEEGAGEEGHGAEIVVGDGQSDGDGRINRQHPLRQDDPIERRAVGRGV